MVGAMQRLDAILQRSKFAIGPRHSGPSTGFPEQGSRCSCWGWSIYGTLCKRWQTKEGTYQLKRRRLLPDVRDPPEQGNAEVDMKDIWNLHGWLGGLLHGGRDAMRGWEGRVLFHLVSHDFANFHWTWCVGFACGLLGAWLCFCFVVFPVKFLHSIRVSLHFEFPVVDRLCLVLARQCREKKKGNQRNPYEEKAYRGPDHREVQARWEQNQRWMWYYKHQRVPLVLDINGFIHAFRGKDDDARAEIDTYMDYCAKRWQTREGTYQLKRWRLLPDVRNPPEQGDEEVDMTDIWSSTWMARWTHYKVEEMRWEAWGARIVSPFLRGFSLALFWFLFVFCLLFCLCCLFLVLFCFLSRWMTPASNSSFTPFLLSHISRVDRPCPVLARQCRRKKNVPAFNKFKFLLS